MFDLSCFRICESGNLTEDEETIEGFVVLLYDRTSGKIDVNECRRELFTKKQKLIDDIPPTKDALHQHVLRSFLQTRY